VGGERAGEYLSIAVFSEETNKALKWVIDVAMDKQTAGEWVGWVGGLSAVA